MSWAGAWGCIVAAILVSLPAGCSSHPGTATAPPPASGHVSGYGNGTVTGRLLAVGGPPPGAPRPMTPGTVTLSGPRQYRVKVDPQGRFHVTVDPGAYRATGTSPLFGSGKYLCRADHPITVSAATAGTVDVYCHML